jgi:hypothetical protein
LFLLGKGKTKKTDEKGPFMATKTKKKRFLIIWRNKRLTSKAKTIQDMLEIYEDTAKYFRQMAKDGIRLMPESCIDDYARLFTYNPIIAKKYDIPEDIPDENICYPMPNAQIPKPKPKSKPKRN